jgi:hypothetical protein
MARAGGGGGAPRLKPERTSSSPALPTRTRSERRSRAGQVHLSHGAQPSRKSDLEGGAGPTCLLCSVLFSSRVRAARAAVNPLRRGKTSQALFSVACKQERCKENHIID